eukprot:8986511-Karenia_brevis.AAC.1
MAPRAATAHSSPPMRSYDIRNPNHKIVTAGRTGATCWVDPGVALIAVSAHPSRQWRWLR